MSGEHRFMSGTFQAGEKSQLLWLISLVTTGTSNKGRGKKNRQYGTLPKLFLTCRHIPGRQTESICKWFRKAVNWSSELTTSINRREAGF
jgi:hypothetical protein